MSNAKSPEEIKDLWLDLKTHIENMERDLEKNLIKGNSAAGRRVRADLRETKKRATNLIKELVAFDKLLKD